MITQIYNFPFCNMTKKKEKKKIRKKRYTRHTLGKGEPLGNMFALLLINGFLLRPNFPHPPTARWQYLKTFLAVKTRGEMLPCYWYLGIGARDATKYF